MTTGPQGKVAVRAAVIAATKQQFANEGPAASIRDIARAAGVNHGLLHRHFGSRDEVIRAAFDDAARNGRALVGDATELDAALDRLFEPVRAGETNYPRMLAWMLLSGVKPEDLQDSFPTITRLIELGGAARRCDVLIALLVIYGWPIFGDHLLLALGYEPDERDAVLDQLTTLLHQHLDGSPPR